MERRIIPCTLSDMGRLVHGKMTPLSDFYDARHPSVYVIPANKHLWVIDEWGDTIGFMNTRLWFSSSNFYLDRENGWLFPALDTDVFWRQGWLSQLGYLVPPPPEHLPDERIAFACPPFGHTRWLHAYICAMLAEVILARAGFSEEERRPIVIAIAYHDCATVAGSDSVKRIDPKNLDEERNFAWVLKRAGLAQRWKVEYGFNLVHASSWVRNRGMFGLLLDIIDKMSYVSLDCYNAGYQREGVIRDHGMTYPLFMDVWEDIRFTPDKKRFAFLDADRLYTFLLARAYEHKQLLLNPYARTFDFDLTQAIGKYYWQGKITKENLLTWNAEQLLARVEPLLPHFHGGLFEPYQYDFKRFSTAYEARNFCRNNRRLRIHHIDHLRGFNPCLEWPVFVDSDIHGKIVPLRQLLSQTKIQFMQRLVDSTKGHCVYWIKNPEQ
ncbi:MAG: hypothetical protein WC289_04880 [Patescibacteria group bacterium]